MKLYGLYEHDDIPNLEYNHRKFCDLNNIEYNKVKVKNYHHKYNQIYYILESNLGETIFFIDSYSYFKNFQFDFEMMTSDMLIQASDSQIYDNFFIVKINKETLKIFKNILLLSADSTAVKKSVEFKLNEELYIKYFGYDISKYIQKYPYNFKDKYLNIDVTLHNNFINITDNILVCVFSKIHTNTDVNLSEILCNHKRIEYKFRDSKFDIINPGKKNALVTLYTDNIKEQGIVSELNIEKFCMLNDITYYVYRDIPDNLSNMTGNWCKPYILLNHINDHDYISWIDSDIIITDGYKMKFDGDIMVYNDPLTWNFNSGYMVFKNNEKNKSLLKGVIDRFNKIERMDSIYVNGGDQTYFIEEVKYQYPKYLPKSSMYTNSYIDISTPSEKMMIHFMGIMSNIRHIIMEYYENKYTSR
jgi:hypothetical protein